MKALIIEDDENLAAVLATWLNSCGYECQITGSLVEAERIIETASELEVITLDLNLEDATREKTIPHIKLLREKSPNALLVVISGVITSQDEKLVTKLGADGMIQKTEIATEKSFWTKLSDILYFLFETPQTFPRKVAILEGIASKIARRCSVLGYTIGAKLQSDIDPTKHL